MVQREAPHRSPSLPVSIRATLPFLPDFLHSSKKFKLASCQTSESESMIVGLRSRASSKARADDNEINLIIRHFGH